jgi:nuclear pore complex protein Nup155
MQAIGLLRRAKEAAEGGERMALLMECLSLFERSAGSLSLENLRDAVDEFVMLKFHSGAVQLALAVAKYSDPTGAGIQYAAEGQPKDVYPLIIILTPGSAGNTIRQTHSLLHHYFRNS